MAIVNYPFVEKYMRISEGKTNMEKMDFENNEETRLCEKKEKKKWSIVPLFVLFILLILLCLLLHSCQIWNNPIPIVDRVYEKDMTTNHGTTLYSDESKRVNLAISGNYRITDERPLFYIGFPKENVFDVVFILKDLNGAPLYQTDYVAPGTNVAIDGTSFLKKGEQQIECLVAIYQQDSGTLVSDCTTMVLNINYE